MPYNYRQLDNHASATKKSGTVTAPGLYGQSSVPVKKDVQRRDASAPVLKRAAKKY